MMILPALPWDFALILLALGVVVPWRGTVRIQKLLNRPALTTAERLSLYASTIAWQWVATGLVAWRCLARGLNATRLGLAIPDRAFTAIVAVGLALLLVANQLFAMRPLARIPSDRRGRWYKIVVTVMPRNPLESLVFLVLALTAAVCEEFLYRGFVFAAVEDMAQGSLMAAALGSAAMFAIAHLYQGRRGLISTFLIGIAFALARIYTGSLLPPIVAHFLIDLVVGLAGPSILKLPRPSTALEPSAAAHPGISEGSQWRL